MLTRTYHIRWFLARFLHRLALKIRPAPDGLATALTRKEQFTLHDVFATERSYCVIWNDQRITVFEGLDSKPLGVLPATHEVREEWAAALRDGAS